MSHKIVGPISGLDIEELNSGFQTQLLTQNYVSFTNDAWLNFFKAYDIPISPEISDLATGLVHRFE